jgi:arylsulfatase
MAETDYNVGLVLDAIDRLKITRHHRALVSRQRRSAAAMARSSGPFSGFYNTVMEAASARRRGRWPGRVPAGRVSNEIVHDRLLPTFAAAAAWTSFQGPRD